MATSALTLARNRGEQGHEAHALRLLGEIATHPDSSDNESAILNYDSALTLARKHGMLPLQAHCHLGLGNLYQRQQQESQARDSFKMAISMYRKLGMVSWGKKAQSAENS